ncbi:NUDIX domain-containing protein [Paenibacillus dakarensis]|uniref:NUDIX domain-containing protein n=1 Tax=Paenibacillus dakarensis TaxID=1527293 RepID=UPI0006D59660|nr:NUDIX domain-containing protein [Paenibacillus dakarensis]
MYHIRVRACALIIEENSILLVEFDDENGLHYNLPTGGAEPGESIIEAVKREVREETNVEVEVGPLAFVYEYAPYLNASIYGARHSLSLMFECKIVNGKPSLPKNPDPNQTNVRWIELDKLEEIVLYPNIKEQIKDYVKNKRNIEIIEEYNLKKQK